MTADKLEEEVKRNTSLHLCFSSPPRSFFYVESNQRKQNLCMERPTELSFPREEKLEELQEVKL
ncbi:hypothetical protein E2C01_062102 [Portunus trituberculatus]|uniref:Uncharacterized protein n=1 Tax=Portunus trituberculatus TaxID=210409 RepID=A0A5B7HD54_PORTR|nr:hypothetical protein [Portunus trituberculatus]